MKNSFSMKVTGKGTFDRKVELTDFCGSVVQYEWLNKNIRMKETDGYYWRKTYITISNEVYEQLKSHFFYPSCTEHATILIEVNSRGLLPATVYSKSFKDGDTYVLEPVDYLCTKEEFDRMSRQPHYKTCWNLFPASNVKCYQTKEDWTAAKAKRDTKTKAKRDSERAAGEELRNVNPTFALATPKLRVLEICKKTDTLVGLKVGDIIEGYLSVLVRGKNSNYGALRGIGTRTNWIKVKVNGKDRTEMSPLVFQRLFLDNFKVEIVENV